MNNNAFASFKPYIEPKVIWLLRVIQFLWVVGPIKMDYLQWTWQNTAVFVKIVIFGQNSIETINLAPIFDFPIRIFHLAIFFCLFPVEISHSFAKINLLIFIHLKNARLKIKRWKLRFSTGKNTHRQMDIYQWIYAIITFA